MSVPTSTPSASRGLASAVLGDGRPLLLLTGLGLALAGGFALFLALTYQFLPHDIAFLGVTAAELCTISNCRVVGFMIHDRMAFGGALLAIGLLYLWLTEFPLREGQPWAWWLLLGSGALGFGSFLVYITTGYLDTWHGVASLLLLPCFLTGLARATQLVRGGRVAWRPAQPFVLGTPLGAGRLCLLLTGLGMVGAGLTILTLGGTVVFVPQDLAFMCITPAGLDALNPRLIPVIVHDRIGFGGAVATTGMVVAGVVWWSVPSRHLWQILLLASLAGFGSAIGAHPFVGYLDAVHLAPAVAGALLAALGLGLCHAPMARPEA